MLLTFLLMHLSPADPVRLIAGDNPDIAASDREQLRESLGLNRPLPVQFADYVWDVARFDFGDSFYYHRPAIELIAERLPNSIQLAVVGTVVSLVIAIPLGMIAAFYRGRAPDHGIRVLTVVAQSVPDFFLGLLFIMILAVQLRWFPIGSMNSVGETCTLCWDRASRLVGPTLLYINGALAVYPRFLRTEMLEILAQDYVRTARAKGLRERAVVGVHALRNSLIPMVTLLGPIITIFFSGSLIIEVLFTWPGIGRLLFDSAVSKDFPVVTAAVLIGAELLLVGYIMRDIAYALVDPRIKMS